MSYALSFEKFESNKYAQRFLGRIELQAEQFAHLVLSCSAEDFRAWLGANLINTLQDTTIPMEEVPAVSGRARSKKAAKRRSEVVVGNKSYGQGTRRKKSTPRKVSAHIWRNPDGTLMTKEQRSAEMKRRVKARSNKKAAA